MCKTGQETEAAEIPEKQSISRTKVSDADQTYWNCALDSPEKALLGPRTVAARSGKL